MVKNFRILLITCLIIGSGVLMFFCFSHPKLAKASALDNVTGWSWSDNIGWISFNCTDVSCASTNYGVNIGNVDPDTGIGDMSGYAWSDNIGWIYFDPAGAYPTVPNYSARYNSSTTKVTGWIRVCSVFQSGCSGALKSASERDDWDGWILLGDETNSWANQVTIESGTKKLKGWAWGSNVVGWIDFGYGVTAINYPPTATDLSKTDPDWCASPPSYFFSWTYSDPEANPESRFDFQVDNNSDFSSPEVNRTYSGLSNPSGSQNNQTVSVAVSALPNYLTYNNTTYYWRVKVWDSGGANSAWTSGSSFTTKPHAYPTVSFTHLPESPVPGEPVQFTNTSTCYDDVSTGSACNANDSFSWTFQDANPGSSTEQNPTVIFLPLPGNKQVTLTITDSYGLPYSCSVTDTLRVSLPLPKWKEIKPL